MSRQGKSTVQLVDFSLPTTPGNLALDQWLLDTVDSGAPSPGWLRLWENPVPAVILGRSSRFDEEVNPSACRDEGVEICRRVSGGAAVVIGPGCLMYSLVLDTRIHPQLKMLDQTHRYVMSRIGDALARCGVTSRFQGTCDLTVDDRKVSGNSLRCTRNALLYHGTLLYGFPIGLIGRLLETPPRQPEYRRGRRHEQFVTNLPVEPEMLRRALQAVWQATPVDTPLIDRKAIAALERERYSRQSWTRSR